MLTIDHVAASARNLDAAAAALERLGFTLTPRSVHPSYGTMRHVVVFETSFYELVSFHDEGRFREVVATLPPAPDNLIWTALWKALQTREGPCLVALASDRPQDDLADLRGRGAEVAEPLHCWQPVVAQNGQETADETEVTVTLLPNQDEPDVSLYISQQHDRQAIWGPPEWRQHRNGALDVASVTYVAEKPLAQVPYFTSIFGDSAERVRDDEFHFDCGSSRIIVTTPALFRSRFGGLDVELPSGVGLEAITIRVGDIDVSAACLEGRGVAFARGRTGSLYVSAGPSEAGGLIEFVEIERRLSGRESRRTREEASA